MDTALHPIEKFLADNDMSQRAFAEALGKPHQSYVGELLRRARAGRPIPADICPAIERVTKGQLSRHDLRPDLFEPRAKKRKAS